MRINDIYQIPKMGMLTFEDDLDVLEEDNNLIFSPDMLPTQEQLDFILPIVDKYIPLNKLEDSLEKKVLIDKKEYNKVFKQNSNELNLLLNDITQNRESFDLDKFREAKNLFIQMKKLIDGFVQTVENTNLPTRKEEARKVKNLKDLLFILKTRGNIDILNKQPENYNTAAGLLTDFSRLNEVWAKAMNIFKRIEQYSKLEKSFKSGNFEIINEYGFTPEEYGPILKIFEEACEKIEQDGLGKLLYGKVFLKTEKDIGTNTSAQYIVGEDIIYLNVSDQLLRFFGTYNIIHELGHRLWFKFLNNSLKNTYEDYYYQGLDLLTKKDRDLMWITLVDTDFDLKKTLNILPKNLKEELINRVKKAQKELDVKLDFFKVEHRTLSEEVYRPIERRFREIIVGKGLKPDEIGGNKYEKPFFTSKTSEENWHKNRKTVTKYATKDVLEDFAENFAYYVFYSNLKYKIIANRFKLIEQAGFNLKNITYSEEQNNTTENIESKRNEFREKTLKIRDELNNKKSGMFLTVEQLLKKSGHNNLLKEGIVFLDDSIDDPFEEEMLSLLRKGKKKAKVYHGTSSNYFWSIINKGFSFSEDRKVWENTSKGVYFSFDKNRAGMYAHAAAEKVGGVEILFVLELPLKILERDMDDALTSDKGSNYQSVVKDNVKPSYITAIVFPVDQSEEEIPTKKFINMVNKNKVSSISPEEESLKRKFSKPSKEDIEMAVLRYTDDLLNYTSFTDYLLNPERLKFRQKLFKKILETPPTVYFGWSGKTWVELFEKITGLENTEDYYLSQPQFRCPLRNIINKYLEE